ncbi:MAG: anti-sigma factor family protein [Longimicrobiales bacterium]
MDCSEVDGMLDAWLDDALPSDERQGLDAHLTTCDACRATVLALRWTQRRLAASFPRMPPRMKQRLITELRRLEERAD